MSNRKIDYGDLAVLEARIRTIHIIVYIVFLTQLITTLAILMAVAS